MYEINKQQGYMVQHRELQLLFCNNVKWSILHKNIECLCCIPESNIIFVNQLYFSKKKKDRTYKNKIEIVIVLHKEGCCDWSMIVGIF